MLKVLLILWIMMLSVNPAWAGKHAEIFPYIKFGQAYGTARLNKFLFHVYDAELWTDARKWSMRRPFALRLTYAMNFKSIDLTRRSVDEMNGQGKLTPAQEKTYYKQLLLLLPNVKKGDSITAIYLPQKGTRLYHNGSYRGSITDSGLSARFIGIWMSVKTSEPEFRNRLLNKTGE